MSFIDIESEVYTNIKAVIPTGTAISGEFIKAPSAFPLVTVEERGNINYIETQTNDNLENHSLIMYEIVAYSDKTNGKKAECKTIMQLVDTEMKRMGFTRITLDYVPNFEDANICRLIGRYSGVVSDNKIIFRK